MSQLSSDNIADTPLTLWIHGCTCDGSSPWCEWTRSSAYFVYRRPLVVPPLNIGRARTHAKNLETYNNCVIGDHSSFLVAMLFNYGLACHLSSYRSCRTIERWIPARIWPTYEGMTSGNKSSSLAGFDWKQERNLIQHSILPSSNEQSIDLRAIAVRFGGFTEWIWIITHSIQQRVWTTARALDAVPTHV